MARGKSKEVCGVAENRIVRLEGLRPDEKALSLIDAATAERLCVLPLELTSDGVLRAMVEDPDDLHCADDLRALTRCQVKLVRSTVADLRAEIRRIYFFQKPIETLSGRLLAEERGTRQRAEVRDDSSPTAEIVQKIFMQALRERASDIHLEPHEDGLRVRYRIDGRLVLALQLSGALHPSLTTRVKVMAGMDIAKKYTPQDGRMMVSFEGRNVDVRVSTLPTIHGEKTVMRLLDPKEANVGLGGLGCTDFELHGIKKLLRVPYGLILNTGPTGSGKSTTLYAMLQQLDLFQFNAVAVEDPVEYSFSNVSQVMVDERSGMTFGSALRSILRQDPDIILVGEIRDPETAMLAVQAALTGHLVLATVHANDAPSAPARLLNMGVPPYQLAAALKGVMAQRLVRVLCSSCRRAVSADVSALRHMGIPADARIYSAGRCAACSGRGYRGRSGLFQIMHVDAELSDMIAAEATSFELADAARRKGMRTLWQAALDKVLLGVTSLEEALSAVGEDAVTGGADIAR